MTRLPGLDLIRAAAILWVLDFHAELFGLVGPDDPVAQMGWMGVDLFFALSGFLIGGQLFSPLAEGRAPDIGRFMARRLLRTLPPYAAVLAIYGLIPPAREHPALLPLWRYLTFTQNLAMPSDVELAFSHAWSLCVEEQFYLAAPLAVWLLSRRPSRWSAGLAFGAVILGGAALRAVIWRHTPHAVGTIYFDTFTRLDDLAAGLALAMVRRLRPALWARVERHGNLVLAAAVVALAGALWLFQDRGRGITNVAGYPLLALATGLLVAAGAGRTSLIGRWRIPGAGLIAGMAYSLYLSHKLAFHLVLSLAGPQGLAAHPIAVRLGVAGAVAIVGGALHLALERPSIAWRDRLLSPRRTAPARSPQPVA